MKLLMDADCLIKLTKAGLKEIVCRHHAVFIPWIVEKEVVDEGKKKGCEDAFAVEINIAEKRLLVLTAQETDYENGDRAVVGIFNLLKHDAIATDDAKLIGRLKILGVPYLLPGLILVDLYRQGFIDVALFRQAIERLAPFISEDEYSTVLLLGEGVK